MPTDTPELSAIESLAAASAESAAQMAPADLGAAAVKMFFSLIVLVALLFLSYWLLRRIIQNRLQRGVGEQAIQILEKRMISPKTTLYLISIENKKILVAESHLEIKRLEGLDQQS